MQNLMVNFLGTWSNTTNYSYLDLGDIILTPVVETGLTPSVTYLGALYVGNNSANPTLGMVPSSDTAWTIVATTESGAAVLATPLTGLVPASGTPTATSTILGAFNNLVYSQTNLPASTLATTLTGLVPASGTPTSASTILGAFNNLVYSQTNMAASTLATPLTGLTVASGTPIAASTILQAMGYLTYKTYATIATASIISIPVNSPLIFTGAVPSTSSNISVVTSTGIITLPVNKTLTVMANLLVSSDAGSMATFTITGSTNAVVSGTVAMSISPNTTNYPITLIATVTTTGGTPTISINSSAVTGTLLSTNIAILING